jgi:F-type H+-transporting ATPase subunit epsilon
MKLKILLPTEIFLEEDVTKVVAEARNGSFCLLPRHVDFVAVLTAGLFSYEDEEGNEVFLAVDEGVLVKQSDKVFLSTRNAVRGPDLGMLERTVEEKFMVLDDREKIARSAVAKIEANFVRRFLEIQKYG